MRAVRQIMDSSLLHSIIRLPEEMQNTLVQITVTPAAKPIKPISRSELLAKLPGSSVEALTGILLTGEDDEDIDLDKMREERLLKYERVD